MVSFSAQIAPATFSSFLTTSALPAWHPDFCSPASPAFIDRFCLDSAVQRVPLRQHLRLFRGMGRLFSNGHFPDRSEQLPSRLGRLFDAIQRSNPTGPYRPLRKLRNFILASESLCSEMSHFVTTHKTLVMRHQNDPWFMKTLLCLALRVRNGSLSSAQLTNILSRAYEWSELLGRKYHGSDLLEKACRDLSLEHFMECDSLSARYEVEVARQLVADNRILEVHPIPPNGHVASPDYRVLVHEKTGSFWNFVEAKLYQPRQMAHFERCAYSFRGTIAQAAYQFCRYLLVHPSVANIIFIAMVDRSGRVDPSIIEEQYAPHAAAILTRYANGRYRVRLLHVDFYSGDFHRRSALDVFPGRF